MNRQKNFYNRVGKEIGWDFSHLNSRLEGNKRNFYSLVKDQLSKESLLLDLGTGGGKKVLSLSNSCVMVMGIDNSEEMVKKAKENASEAGVANSRFFHMDADELKFPDSLFDFVSCRQAAFNPYEVFRVLKKRGVFMTQQVSPDDKEKLKKTFGRGQDYDLSLAFFKEEIKEKLLSAGFKDIKLDHYRVKEYFQDLEDLKFLLKNTPIIEDFGLEGDLELLQSFVDENRTDKGIVTLTCRVIVSCHK
ncbi:methyltransferase domain-containing protein [Candidatus Bipolaricaulota bacterium]|nr:methyltransferase domain-containing protein [Candidatus Bipolaricaulota bacterium]